MVLNPLAVLLGLKEPQLPDGTQLQVTPALAESLLTAAAMLACAVTPMFAGGVG